MKRLAIDTDYLQKTLLELLAIPSPAGLTDEIVHFTAESLQKLGIGFELTRRGAIRAHLEGRLKSPDRALVVHLDTTGAMVKGLKENGRLAVAPIGHWSSRFAEGCRVSVYCDRTRYRGTLLPLKASGHTFGEEIDSQPVSWENLELRVDAVASSRADLVRLGLNVGDFVAVDPRPEITETGFINSRHLDNKAGVATLLAAVKAVLEEETALPVDCHLLFTITEEIGSGASAVLHRDVAEMVSIDNATPAPGQNSRESGVTIPIMDSSGPFDFHLCHKLLALCRDFDIAHQRDIFRYYRCDSASAVEAGNDIRTALICFGVDASHGYERTHLNSLRSLAELITLYLQSEPTFMRDRDRLGTLQGFPSRQVGAEGVEGDS